MRHRGREDGFVRVVVDWLWEVVVAGRVFDEEVAKALGDDAEPVCFRLFSEEV